MDRYILQEMSRRASITLGIQRETREGQPLEIPGRSAALPNMQFLLDAFRRYERPIVHVVRLHKPDDSNVDFCWRDAVDDGTTMLLAGSQGSELVSKLCPVKSAQLNDRSLLDGRIQPLAPGRVAINLVGEHLPNATRSLFHRRG
jgi:nicotinamidase-related amidase